MDKNKSEDPVAAMYEERAEWILRTPLSINIPDHLWHSVNKQVASGKFEDADHYIAALIKRDLEGRG